MEAEERGTRCRNWMVVAGMLLRTSLTPVNDQAISECKSSTRVRSQLIAVEEGSSKSGLDVFDNLFLKFVFVFEASSRIFAPCFTHVLRDTRLDCLDVAGTKACCGSFVLGPGEARANLGSIVSQMVRSRGISPYWTLESRDWCMSAHLPLTGSFVDGGSGHGGVVERGAVRI